MLIGRKDEVRALTDAYKSDRSEFIAIYGRRRIGKTFLVRETFDGKFSFSYSGIYNVSTKAQLQNFHMVLKQHGASVKKNPVNWIEAFGQLSDYLNGLPKGKKIVFIDELPWMDGPKSSFLPAFENFWNGWASARKDILLIICGSATSWVVNKIFHNKGGLHNRLSDKIYLRPFTLGECEEYSKSQRLNMPRKVLVEAYMILGGVPYYWSLLKRGQSLASNINALFFAREAKLKDEFKELYSSLFKNPEPYMAVITALGNKKVGMTREEIIRETSLPDTGRIKIYLEELESSGFIRRYNAIGSKTKNALFQLIDNFTLFHFRFLSKKTLYDEDYWSKIQGTSKYNNWSGHAFERTCLQHTNLIKRALGIQGVLTSECSWRALPSDGQPGAEIDLLIDRNDKAINIIEIKFTKGRFAISKKYLENLENKRMRLQNSLKSHKSIFLTMLTFEGLAENEYSYGIDTSFTSDILFQ
ncbi:MAG: ATP-binding protein [Muribaculaceae bacterium]|nr:ATP-binding protein [Muribaculaceae bacterium]